MASHFSFRVSSLGILGKKSNSRSDNLHGLGLGGGRVSGCVVRGVISRFRSDNLQVVCGSGVYRSTSLKRKGKKH